MANNNMRLVLKIFCLFSLLSACELPHQIATPLAPGLYEQLNENDLNGFFSLTVQREHVITIGERFTSNGYVKLLLIPFAASHKRRIFTFASNIPLNFGPPGVADSRTSPSNPVSPGTFTFIERDYEREELLTKVWSDTDSKGHVYVSGTLGHVLITDKNNETLTQMRFRDLWNTPVNHQPSHIQGIAVGADDTVYFSDPVSQRIFKIDDQRLEVIADAASNKEHSAGAERFEPAALEVDKQGNVYFLEWKRQTIRKLAPDGKISLLAGSDERGYVDGKGSKARFNQPFDLALNASGEVFVSDAGNNRIRKITPDGTVSTVLGTGEKVSRQGRIEQVSIAFPDHIDISPDGTLYLLDNGRLHRVRLN